MITLLMMFIIGAPLNLLAYQQACLNSIIFYRIGDSIKLSNIYS